MSLIQGPSFVSTGETTFYYVTGTGTFTWSVTNGNILSGQGTDTIVVQWVTSGSGLITVTGGVSDNLNTTVSGAPVITISGASPVCTGVSSNYSIDSIPGATITWWVRNGSILAQTSTQATVEWASIPSGLIEVQATGVGNDKSGYLSISTVPAPAPVLSSLPKGGLGSDNERKGLQTFLYAAEEIPVNST